MSCALGIDIGGTKTLVALVAGGQVLAERVLRTQRNAPPEVWLEDIARAASDWRGQYDAVGSAVTGVVVAGRWSAMNPQTLCVPENFALADTLAERFAMPVHCCNDAQAAAWGEHRFGAGRGEDLVFITVSTGIGGGAVIDGKLLRGRAGLACSAGLTRAGNSLDAPRVEAVAGGQGIAAAARAAGFEQDAREVFAAAARGRTWAQDIVAMSADAVANLLVNLQLLFDPPAMVLGGGVGLAPGYIEALRTRMSAQPSGSRPDLRLAALGRHAGVIGAAALARMKSTNGGTR